MSNVGEVSHIYHIMHVFPAILSNVLQEGPYILGMAVFQSKLGRNFLAACEQVPVATRYSHSKSDHQQADTNRLN